MNKKVVTVFFYLCQQSFPVKVWTGGPSGFLPNMRIEDVVSFNGVPSIDSLWSIVSVHECEDEDFDMKSEDKILVAMLINMKHYTSGPSNNIKLRYGGNYGIAIGHVFAIVEPDEVT